VKTLSKMKGMTQLTNPSDYDRHTKARTAIRSILIALEVAGYSLAELSEAIGNECQELRSRLHQEETSQR
jgi:hypothetical protein